ncbi:MAG: LAGLIDADG family homing endonuclease, partial [Promethearchaeota archaeon]
TDEGWKFFKDLNKTEKVATLNPKINKLEFIKPINYVKYYYKGDMFKIKRKNIDLLITPNHNLYAKTSNWKDNYNFQTIESIYNRYSKWIKVRMPTFSIWKGRNKKYFYLPKISYEKESIVKEIHKIKMDNWLEFFGWWLSEGSLAKIGKNKKSYVIYIYQTNEKNRMKIRQCLDKLPFHYREDSQSFIIGNKQLYSYLKQFGKSYEKFIPKEFLNLSFNQLTILYDTLMLGDGNKWGGYYTTSKKLVNDIQEILRKLGYCSSVKQRKRKSHHKVCYEIQKLSKKNICFSKKNISKESYEDYVYCVEVPSHIIFIRRNGQTCFCGNSHLIYSYEKELRNTQFNYNEIHIDIQNDGSLITLYPSITGVVKKEGKKEVACYGLVRRKFITPLKLEKIPSQFKKFLLKNSYTKKSKDEKFDVVNYKHPILKDGDGRNNDAIHFAGAIRQFLSLSQMKRVIRVWDKMFCEPPLDTELDETVFSSVEKYCQWDEDELVEKILNYLNEAGKAKKYDIVKAVLEEVPSGDNKVKFDRTLNDLLEAHKIKLDRGQYSLVKRVEWETSLVNLMNPLDFKLPYLDRVANLNYGEMVIIGATSGDGKTHITANIIEKLVKQGKKPIHLIEIEPNKLVFDILVARGLREGEVKYKNIDPTEVELEPNSITVIDWLLPQNYAEVDKLFYSYNRKLLRSGGFLIVFMQLHRGNY